MKKLLFFTILLFGQAHAADLYYCKCDTGAASSCVAGSDSDDGLTPATAKESGANARSAFSSLTPGDTIYFCKGGAWGGGDGSGSWSNSSSTNANRVSVSTYSPSWGGTKRPYFNKTSNASFFSLTSGQGYNFSGLHLYCSGCGISGGARGISIDNGADYITASDMEIEYFRHGFTVLNSGNPDFSNGIIIQNSEIHHNWVQGIYAAIHTGSLTIHNNIVHHNGEANMYDHNIYIGKSSNVTITNNELYASSTGNQASNPNATTCNGVSMVIHGLGDNYLIEGNYLHESDATGGCYGITFDGGYGYAEGWTNVTIRNNKLKDLGQIYIGVSNCDTCVVENNILIDSGTGITSNYIQMPSKPEAGELWHNTNVQVRNNTFYSASTNNSTGINIYYNSQSGIVSTNNAIHYTGTNNGFNCFSYDTGQISFTEIDNNICYHPNAPSAEWENGSGTLAAWRGATVWDQNSSESDPGFIDPANGDFRLSGSSSAINMGNTTYYAVRDFLGFARGTNPDIGAFEGLYNPPAATALYLQ